MAAEEEAGRQGHGRAPDDVDERNAERSLGAEHQALRPPHPHHTVDDEGHNSCLILFCASSEVEKAKGQTKISPIQWHAPLG